MGNSLQSFQQFQQKYYFYMFHYCCQFYFWFQKQFLFLSDRRERLEPSQEMNWINIYEKIKKDQSKNHYRFHYEDESESFDPFLEKEYNYFLKTCLKLDTEQLFIAKEQDHYMFLQFPFISTKPETIVKMPELSTIDFVYVEYKHPCILREIELVIPRGYYLVGNELFSPSFILRMLQMQSTYFVFDNRYSIRIMDHEVKTITLGPENYILIQKDDYVIKKRIEEMIKEEDDVEEDYLIFSDEEPTIPFTMHGIMSILFP